MSKILAIRGGALGDFLTTLPAITAWHRMHPGSELHLLARPSHLELALALGVADGGRSIESAGLAPLGNMQARWSPDWLAWLGEFDAAGVWLLDPQEMAAEQLRRAGIASVRMFPAAIFCEDLPAFRQFSAGLPDAQPCAFQLAPLSAARLVGFHPGSGSRRKNWPLQCWEQLLAAMRRSAPSVRFALFTGEAEEDRIESILTACRSAEIDCVHHHCLTLPRLAAELSGCRLFLGHDSGVAHLAAAVGTQCRVLFGPGNSTVWSPQGADVRVLAAPQADFTRLLPKDVLDFLAADL
jgi:heptosyltransferase-2